MTNMERIENLYEQYEELRKKYKEASKARDGNEKVPAFLFKVH